MPKIIEPILSPQDAAWGRQVNDRQGSLESSLDRFSLEQLATNKGVAASVSSLQEQVRDLTGRIAYVADGSGTSQAWSTSTVTPFTWGPTLTFTLTEARVVSIQSLILLECWVQANNSTTSAFASARSALFLNGVLISGARGEIGTNVGTRPDSNRGNFALGTAVSRSLVTIPSGTHVVQGGFFYRTAELNGSPAAGSATVTAKDPSIFVDVLQTTGA